MHISILNTEIKVIRHRLDQRWGLRQVLCAIYTLKPSLLSSQDFIPCVRKKKITQSSLHLEKTLQISESNHDLTLQTSEQRTKELLNGSSVRRAFAATAAACGARAAAGPASSSVPPPVPRLRTASGRPAAAVPVPPTRPLRREQTRSSGSRRTGRALVSLHPARVSPAARAATAPAGRTPRGPPRGRGRAGAGRRPGQSRSGPRHRSLAHSQWHHPRWQHQCRRKQRPWLWVAQSESPSQGWKSGLPAQLRASA